jgi:DNA-binding PadR family transcriptional regulator
MWHFGGRHFGRRGWLRPWMLGLLAKGPKNGAELMDEIERSSWGWRPSPGSVYPLLEELSHEGFVRRRDDGRYEVTERGREGMSGPWDLFGGRPATVEAMVDEMRSNVAYLEDLRASDPTRLAPHTDRIREVGQRLTKLAGA